MSYREKEPGLRLPGPQQKYAMQVRLTYQYWTKKRSEKVMGLKVRFIKNVEDILKIPYISSYG
jgi:hypothetical protein